MKHVALMLSAAPIALAAAPAFGQVATVQEKRDAAQPDAPVEAQAPVAEAQAPASAAGRSPGTAATEAIAPAGRTAAPAAESGEVVVTGYRASLGSAQQVKRNSGAILDAIVAQDIGKLPDNTAAESLARVTGIQVNRFADEAREVLVRGLVDLTHTFNGREFFTAEQRRSNIQDFPAGSLAGLEVYKSGTADLIEPGLAGLINVRTNRPFDFDGFAIAGGIRGTYNDQSGKYDPLGNLLISHRTETPIGEIGVLINGSYTQSQYRNATRWASGFIPTPTDAQVVTPESAGRTFRLPERIGVNNDTGKRWRPSVNASVQWKPASNLEIYYDFLFQGFRGDLAFDQYETSLIAQGASLENVVLVDGKPDQVRSLTKTGGERGQMYRSTGREKTDGYQSAGGAIWTVGRAKLTTDLAYTRSRFVARNWSFDTAMASPQTVNVDFDADGGVAFDLPGFDASNRANYLWRGYFERLYIATGDGWQWRGDVDLDTDISFLPKLQFGLRWTDRTSSLQQGTRYAFTEPLGIALADTPTGALALTQDTFRGDVQGWRQWLMPSRSGIAGNAAALRALARASLQQLVAANPEDAGYANALRLFGTEEVQIDPVASFLAKESSYAAYAQGKYEFAIGSVEFDGLVGARIVNTDGTYSGNSSVTFNGVNEIVPVSVRQNYVDVLPNLSIRMKPTNELQFRLAYTKTRSRPSFGALNPSINISQNTAPVDPTAPGVRPNAFGSAGNPNLSPLTSHNFDATAEYYFSRNGSVTGAVFYRDLFGFINNFTRLVDDPQFGLLQISRPENSGDGRILGVEISGQTFLDFLPGDLNGFGIQANVTYIDGKNRLPATIVADPPLVRIPGLSKWTYNAALFYEKGKISTRLSYNGRSQFINSYSQATAGGGFTGEGTRAITRLDYSFNYTPVKQLTLTFDASNLLAQPFRNFANYADDRIYPRDVREEGRYYGLGARFRF